MTNRIMGSLKLPKKRMTISLRTTVVGQMITGTAMEMILIIQVTKMTTTQMRRSITRSELVLTLKIIKTCKLR